MTSLSASLDQILQISPVAWYRSSNGVTAYYEKAAVDAPGIIAVNGRRIGRVFFPKIDLTQPYQPSDPEQKDKLRIALASYGVPIEYGWMCGAKLQGMSLPDAFRQSSLSAARHEAMLRLSILIQHMLRSSSNNAKCGRSISQPFHVSRFVVCRNLAWSGGWDGSRRRSTF